MNCTHFLRKFCRSNPTCLWHARRCPLCNVAACPLVCSWPAAVPPRRARIAAPPRRPLRDEPFANEPSTGALLALPPPVLTLRRSRSFFITSALRCFVAMSAGLSAAATISTPSSSRFTWSCTQRYRTFRCLSFPNPALRTIPIAALASVCIVTLTKIAQQGHHPEALGRSFGQRVELSLCA